MYRGRSLGSRRTGLRRSLPTARMLQAVRRARAAAAAAARAAARAARAAWAAWAARAAARAAGMAASRRRFLRNSASRWIHRIQRWRGSRQSDVERSAFRAGLGPRRRGFLKKARRNRLRVRASCCGYVAELDTSSNVKRRVDRAPFQSVGIRAVNRQLRGTREIYGRLGGGGIHEVVGGIQLREGDLVGATRQPALDSRGFTKRGLDSPA